VDYQQALVEVFDANLNALFPIAAGLALVLLFITVTLIFNTTHLNLYAKRLELKSQQLVGATEWYIIKPFLKQALGQGLVAGVISAFLLFNLGYLLLYFYPSFEMLLHDFDLSINLSLLAFMVVGLSCSVASSQQEVPSWR
jgi:cell division transport system permease protein